MGWRSGDTRRRAGLRFGDGEVPRDRERPRPAQHRRKNQLPRRAATIPVSRHGHFRPRHSPHLLRCPHHPSFPPCAAATQCKNRSFAQIHRCRYGEFQSDNAALPRRSGGDLRHLGDRPDGGDGRLLRPRHREKLHHGRQLHRADVCGGNHGAGLHPAHPALRRILPRTLRQTRQTNASRLVVVDSHRRSVAWLTHHRAGSDDDCRPAVSQEILSAQAIAALRLRHAGPVIRQHLRRRSPHEFRRPARPNGRPEVGPHHPGNAAALRRQGDSRDRRLQRDLLPLLSQRACRHGGTCGRP